jgi:hypothetical protein
MICDEQCSQAVQEKDTNELILSSQITIEIIFTKLYSSKKVKDTKHF